MIQEEVDITVIHDHAARACPTSASNTDPCAIVTASASDTIGFQCFPSCGPRARSRRRGATVGCMDGDEGA
jgi:hypothetical protein